jgi:rubrerythrin
MAKSTTKDETTKLENSTYNILIALGKDADFLYDTIDTYVSDAQKDNNSELEKTWNTIKEDRKRHMDMLRSALEREAKEQKLSH